MRPLFKFFKKLRTADDSVNLWQKKKLGKKKWLVVLLATLVANLARAFIAIIIGILVLVVGAFVIYKLIRLIHQVLPSNPPPPTPPPTNNVVQIWESPGDGTSWPIVIIPPIVPGAIKSLSDSTTFSLLYGVSFNPFGYGDPWTESGVTMSTSNCATRTSGAWELINNDHEDKVMVTEGDTMVTYDFDVVNNTYTTSDSRPIPTNTIPVVIERTTNFVVWVPIFTNTACDYNTVNGFTDSDAPIPWSFYRIKYMTP